MPIQVWYDDSGSPSSNNWLFMHAGLVASAETWATFADEWRACLDEYPTIAYFKMREAMREEGQFDGMKMATRVAKAEKLAALVARYAMAGHHASVDTRTFADTFANDTGPFRYHYVTAAMYAVFGACVDIYARGFTADLLRRFLIPTSPIRI